MKNFFIKAIAILGTLFISLSIVSYFLYEVYEPNALVKAQTLNVRSMPSVSDEDSSIIITLERGDSVEVLKVDTESTDGYIWAYVRFIDNEGKVNRGFCVSDYLIISEAPSTSTEAKQVE